MTKLKKIFTRGYFKKNYFMKDQINKKVTIQNQNFKKICEELNFKKIIYKRPKPGLVPKYLRQLQNAGKSCK